MMEPNEPSEACVICLSPISERAVASCGHCPFDFGCLVSWLQQRSTCPLCKAEVTAVTYQYSSPSTFHTYHVRPTDSASTTRHTSSAYTRSRSAFPRRPRARRRSYSPVIRDVALLRRRHVYRNQLYSLHVGINDISQHRNITPQMVAKSPELQSRARTWIRRELRVFSFLYAEPSGAPTAAVTTSSNAEFLLSYIVSILKAIDIKASDGQAEDILQEYLGRANARLFLHELNAWLRSPYTKLEEWDRHVQYREQLPDEFDSDGRPVQGRKGVCDSRCSGFETSGAADARREYEWD